MEFRKICKKRKLFEKVALGIDKKDSFDKWKNYLFKLKAKMIEETNNYKLQNQFKKKGWIKIEKNFSSKRN